MSVSTAASEPSALGSDPLRVARFIAVLLSGVLGGSPSFASGWQVSPEEWMSKRVESVVATWADGSADPVPESVTRLISVRPGTRLRPLAVRQSVKQIFALGRYRDVRVVPEPTSAGGLRLVFELDPIPRIARLELRGAPRGERENLVEALGLDIGQALPDLPVAAERAEDRLHSVGYLTAEVDIRMRVEGRDLAVATLVTPGPQARIASFRVEGVESVEPALGDDLRRAIGVSRGRRWSEREIVERLPDAEQTLRDRGYLTAAARLDFDEVDQAGVHLVLLVELGPRVSFEVWSSPTSDEEFRAVLERLPERRLTRDTLEEARQEILDGLQRDGHRDAQVTVRGTDTEDGRRRVVRFSVVPGPRYLIGETGAEGIPPGEAETVGAALSSFRAGLPFREQEWTSAVEGLRHLLRRRGFHRAEVEAEAVPAGGGSPTMDLTARIASGRSATIGGIRFEGQEPFARAELVEVSGLMVGSPFVPEEVVIARENLESWYRNRGFLEAALEVEAPVDPISDEAEVLFRIRPGNYFTVGGIVIAGLEATRESVVRARLPFKEGDPLGSEDLLEVRQRLASMGIFRRVEVTLLEPEEPVSERNLLIRVAESPRTSIGYGAGYSEREQVRGEAEWTRNNMLGLNHTMSLFARLSLKGSRLVATYRGAESVGGSVPIFLSAFREAQDRESLDFIRSGIGVQVTRRVAGRDLFLRYDFSTSELFDLKIHPNQIDRSFADDLWLSAVSASLVSDSRDDPVDSRQGRFGIVDLKWSSSLLGSRAPFLKGLAQQYLFFPVGGRVVLAMAGRLGMAWTIGEDAPVLVPITERFFAGGATTLRGFRLDRAGPLDESGFPLGGNMLIIGNIEVRFPILGSLRGALFSDHGGVYSEVRSLRAGNLRHNAGAGLRWNTPLGPVRFDYGIRIGDIGDARRGQWHFTIGHAF